MEKSVLNRINYIGANLLNVSNIVVARYYILTYN
jgi:hypothetical protein